MESHLTKITEIYEALDLGNIAKVLSILDEEFIVHLPGPFGGDYKGREGILELISKKKYPVGHFEKIRDQFVVFAGGVIVLGNIFLHDDDHNSAKIPFVDVWKVNNDRITEAEIYFLDPFLLADFINQQ